MADRDTDGRDVKRPGASPGYPPDAIEALERKLGQVQADHKRLLFHCRFGDYAGRVFNVVEKAAKEAGAKLPTRVSKLAANLTEEVSACSSGSDKVVRNLETIVDHLQASGLPVDLDMVKVAIFAYSTRNSICHSEAGNPRFAIDLDRLSRLIDRDLEDLPDVLPDDETEHLDTWKRILHFYRRSQEVRNERWAGTELTHLKVPDAGKDNASAHGATRPEDEKDSNASKSRRRQATSDPTSNVSALKRMASGSPVSDRKVKSARMLGRALGTNNPKAEEEWIRKSEGLLHELDDLYRKNPGQAHRTLNDCKRILTEAGRVQKRLDKVAAAKASKKDRRKTKVEGRKA